MLHSTGTINKNAYPCHCPPQEKKKILPDGELNPGLPRDRRGYYPLYYRGLILTLCRMSRM